MNDFKPSRRRLGSVSRRSLLTGVAGLSVAATVAGCRTDAQPGGGPGGGGGAASEYVAPKHIPFGNITPEFPAKPGGVPPGYIELPEPPPSVGKVPLPKTDPITMLLQGNPPKTPFDKNQWYKRLTEEGGTEFSVSWGGFTEYRDKFQVTMASGEIPDLVMIDQIPQLPTLLESKFTDLSEFLSGDKIAEYPGLASIPSAVWQVPVVNGRLWGVTKSRPAGEGKVMLARGDLLSKRGVDPAVELEDGDDFLALLDELSDPERDFFSMGADPSVWLIDLLKEMHGTPNGWRNDDGNFVNEIETEEMKAALETAASIWSKKYLHPNSIAQAANNYIWWSGDITALYIDGVAGWGSHARSHPEWNVQGITVPKWDGGGPARKHLADAGYPYYVAIRRQKSPDRVREILSFMDYIAAPFGTEEFRTVNYGVEGVHVTYANGEASSSDLAGQEVSSIGYLGSQVSAQLYVPHNRQLVKSQQDYLAAVLPEGERDASKGLYSETASSQGAVQEPKIADAVRAIIQNRRPLSEWDAVVADWRTQVGDKAREEYAAAAQ